MLNIMEHRGFETTKYRNISPKEIEAMSVAQNTLNMILPHKTEDGRYAHVIYYLSRISRQKAAVYVTDYIDGLGEAAADKKIEVILMLDDTISEMHHKIALDYYIQSKEPLKSVGMFCIYNMINNPLEHILVPKHTIVPPEEHKALMERLMIGSKGQLPMIKFHQDPIARCLGLVPGDIVKIERPSVSAGVYETYRVCVP